MRKYFNGFGGVLIGFVLAGLTLFSAYLLQLPEGWSRLAAFGVAAILFGGCIAYGSTSPKPPTTNAMGKV